MSVNSQRIEKRKGEHQKFKRKFGVDHQRLRPSQMRVDMYVRCLDPVLHKEKTQVKEHSDH
jgi:hypothetical protein